MSAALDTVDHHILLTRLSTSNGITGQPLAWLRSYLEGSVMRVEMGSDRWACTTVVPGVPQDSELGPLLYILCTAIHTAIITSLGSRTHQFANDLELFTSCRPGDVLSCVYTMNAVVKKLRIRDLPIV